MHNFKQFITIKSLIHESAIKMIQEDILVSYPMYPLVKKIKSFMQLEWVPHFSHTLQKGQPSGKRSMVCLSILSPKFLVDSLRSSH